MMWLLACANSMHPTGGAPFELATMQSAIIVQTPDSDPEAGVGFADLTLSSGVLSCGDAAEDLDDRVGPDGSVVQLRLRWYHESFDIDDPPVDMGWEGLYLQAEQRAVSDQQGAVHRSFFTTVYTDQQQWQLDQFPGELEVTSFGDQVEGRLDQQWVRGRFSAERCGQVQSR